MMKVREITIPLHPFRELKCRKACTGMQSVEAFEAKARSRRGPHLRSINLVIRPVLLNFSFLQQCYIGDH